MKAPILFRINLRDPNNVWFDECVCAQKSTAAAAAAARQAVLTLSSWLRVHVVCGTYLSAGRRVVDCCAHPNVKCLGCTSNIDKFSVWLLRRVHVQLLESTHLWKPMCKRRLFLSSLTSVFCLHSLPQQLHQQQGGMRYSPFPLGFARTSCVFKSKPLLIDQNTYYSRT